MVLSQDATCYWDAMPEETLLVVMPNWHYVHIHNDVIPALKDRGVTDEQLTTTLVDNARKIFENQGAYGSPAFGVTSGAEFHERCFLGG